MSKITDYGFDFGSLQVTRVCGDEDAAHIISIKTQKREFLIIKYKFLIIK